MYNEVLLKVADKIEAMKNYSGVNWWNSKTKCGCAMTEIVLENSGRNIVFERDDNCDFLYNGEEHCGSDVVEIVAEITQDTYNFWNREFWTFSISASNIDTANVLRLIANGKYDYDLNIGSNLIANGHL